MKMIAASAMILTSLLGLRKKRVLSKKIYQPLQSIYDLKLRSLSGKEVSLSQFKGKKILVVNTASKCGFAAQLEKLQQLQEKYADKLVVLGFPSDDFAGQELHDNTEIEQYCTKNYGVNFRLFEKSAVKGNKRNEVFEWLSNKEKNGWNNKQPNWNFCKYLIDENGELANYFSFTTSPLSKRIIQAICN